MTYDQNLVFSTYYISDDLHNAKVAGKGRKCQLMRRSWRCVDGMASLGLGDFSDTVAPIGPPPMKEASERLKSRRHRAPWIISNSNICTV